MIEKHKQIPHCGVWISKLDENETDCHRNQSSEKRRTTIGQWSLAVRMRAVNVLTLLRRLIFVTLLEASPEWRTKSAIKRQYASSVL